MDNSSNIIDLVCGTVDGYEQALRKYRLTDEALLEILANGNIEQCPTCEWYVESGELLPLDGADDPDGYCENCRPPV